MATSLDVNMPKNDYIGSTSNVIPETNAQGLCAIPNQGVSTRFVIPKYTSKKNESHWYALRTTYGRERKAYDFIIQHDGVAFLPTIKTIKIVNGKKTLLEVSRIPNVFFAYGTEDTIKGFVYDNVNLPYLRFYYKYTNSRIQKTPLIVPDNQIKSLQIICESKDDADILMFHESVEKFEKGEKVRIVEGDFKGVTGVVARFHGQQRVGLVIDGLLTAVTAYIPTAFIEKI